MTEPVWELTAAFQFADQHVELQPIFEGDQGLCERLCRRIEAKSQLGIRGLRYDGESKETPVGVYLVVGPKEEA